MAETSAAAVSPVPAAAAEAPDVEKLTPDQREEIRQAFSFYDRDGDDKIKTSDLGIVIRSLGHGLLSLSLSLFFFKTHDF